MKLFKIKFPELAHLPETERETILRRCAASSEMWRFKNQLRYVGFIPLAISFPLFFLFPLRAHWDFLPAFGFLIGVLCLSSFAMFAGVLVGMTRIYRRLVRLELGK